MRVNTRKTGQRVRSLAPVSRGRIGTIVGWDSDVTSEPLAIVRFDEGDEVYVVPDLLEEIVAN